MVESYSNTTTTTAAAAQLNDSSFSQSESDLVYEVCSIYARLGICTHRLSCEYFHPSKEDVQKTVDKI